MVECFVAYELLQPKLHHQFSLTIDYSTNDLLQPRLDHQFFYESVELNVAQTNLCNPYAVGVCARDRSHARMMP